jgi:hypothetical protein
MNGKDLLDPFGIFKKISRPSLRSDTNGVGRRIQSFFGSSILALFIAVLAWLVPSPELRAVLRFILALIFLAVLSIFLEYIVKWVKYIQNLESIKEYLRIIFLANAGMNPHSEHESLIFEVTGISERSGTVCLVLPYSDEIQDSSLLDVIVSATGDVWGTVQVIGISNDTAYAVPIDRKVPDFWESLEDRMKVDPSPPPGIHLGPYMEHQVREFFRLSTEGYGSNE